MTILEYVFVGVSLAVFIPAVIVVWYLMIEVLRK